MKTVLYWFVTYLIRAFTEQALTAEHIQRVQRFIIAQADAAIDNVVKHQRAAALIKDLVGTTVTPLSDTVVDWIIRTLLWVSRLVGEIPDETPA